MKLKVDKSNFLVDGYKLTVDILIYLNVDSWQLGYNGYHLTFDKWLFTLAR